MKSIKSFWRLILLCVISVGHFVVSATTNDGNNQSNETPIIIIKGTGQEHRTLLHDIEAYHTNNMVYLTFNEDLGLVDIVITNTDRAAQIHTSADSACGNLLIDISTLGQGEFNILIITCNATYTGSFIL